MDIFPFWVNKCVLQVSIQSCNPFDLVGLFVHAANDTQGTHVKICFVIDEVIGLVVWERVEESAISCVFHVHVNGDELLERVVLCGDKFCGPPALLLSICFIFVYVTIDECQSLMPFRQLEALDGYLG